MFIQTSSDLADFCQALAGVPYIAVDTEFMREKSYYAHLCLIQVAHGDHAATIDPLADGLDLGPLRDLLLDPNIIKVLHAATQDLEIFLNKIGSVPAPVFDTQIAAAVCGMGEQPGYAKLVQNMLNIQIDKSSQVTDWSLRPLSKRQLDYALADVTHLCVVYELLVAELEINDRSTWVHEEMEALLDASRYVVAPREAYKRIKLRRPKAKTLAVLRELGEWREETAMRKDIPRKWVMRDDILIEIAQSLPADANELARVRSLKLNVAKGSVGTAMLDAVDRALALPAEDWPKVPKGRPKISGHESLVALLGALLQQRCEAHEVAASVVAKRAHLDRIATEDEPDVPAMHGWRRKVFGADALELCAGRLALTGGNGKVVDVAAG